MLRSGAPGFARLVATGLVYVGAFAGGWGGEPLGSSDEVTKIVMYGIVLAAVILAVIWRSIPGTNLRLTGPVVSGTGLVTLIIAIVLLTSSLGSTQSQSGWLSPGGATLLSGALIVAGGGAHPG